MLHSLLALGQSEITTEIEALASAEIEMATSFGLDARITAALIAAIVAALIGIVNIVIAVRKSQTEGITNNRVAWISKVRDITTDIVNYDFYAYENDEESLKEANNKLYQSAYSLFLHLNVIGPFDNIIMDYICKFVKTIFLKKDDNNDDFIKYKRLLILAIQI